MRRIRLTVKGISGSPEKPEAYILMLGEQGGSKIFPVVTGFSEAQSIAYCMEKVPSSRPFSHDLFFNLAKECNIEVLEIFIRKFQDSVFYVDIICFDGNKQFVLDARLPDAVAIAMRFRCPIFTTEDVMNMTGVNITHENKNSIENFSMEELLTKLNEVVQNEDYEMAITIRNEIRKRNKK